jgi:fluoroacetyl-CoA thioesterase
MKDNTMKPTLVPGLTSELRFEVPPSKTVPALYPESPEFLQMPPVFATGFLVGLLEWTCVKAINPHLDWPHELTLGTHIDVSHSAATPPGLHVVVQARLTAVDGRRLVFAVEAHDGQDVISKGRHERFVVQRGRFDEKVKEKAARGRTGRAA